MPRTLAPVLSWTAAGIIVGPGIPSASTATWCPWLSRYLASQIRRSYPNFDKALPKPGQRCASNFRGNGTMAAEGLGTSACGPRTEPSHARSVPGPAKAQRTVMMRWLKGDWCRITCGKPQQTHTHTETDRQCENSPESAARVLFLRSSPSGLAS